MRSLLALPLCCFAAAQELLWEVAPAQHSYGITDSIGDYDGDGWSDLLVPALVDYRLHTGYFAIRILSGVNGAVLDDRNAGIRRHAAIVVGDFDGDGYEDYATSWWDSISTSYVEVWSPRLRQQLLLVSAPSANQFGSVLAGRVDLNGDGRPDLLVGSTRPYTGDTRAYDHSGALLYQIPVGLAVVLDLEGLPDLDGDGCSDFLVGGVDYTLGFSRGYVALHSGRTGARIRVAFDQQRGDLIGKPLAAAGDMDRDGVIDYATGNYWGNGSRALITVYSGATGAILTEVTSSSFGISADILAGLDADLDGVADVIGSSPNYNSGPTQQGALHAFSSRDRQMLFRLQPQPGTSYTGSYGLALASLGVQPGSPYPVIALWDETIFSSYRIQVWRCTPAGASVTGDGCSSAAQPPTIGVRRVETPSGVGSRLVLGSAPPGAFAWCAVAPAALTTFAGAPLPIALDPLGYAGCSLQVPAITTAARGVGGAGFDLGYAEVNLPLPLVATGGFHAAAQWLVLDPSTSGHALTPRCVFRVQ